MPFLTHVTLPRVGATKIILRALVARQENGSPAGGDTKELGMMVFNIFFLELEAFLEFFFIFIILLNRNNTEEEDENII